MRKVGKIEITTESIRDIIKKAKDYAEERKITYDMIQIEEGDSIIVPISDDLAYVTSICYWKKDKSEGFFQDFNVVISDKKDSTPIPVEYLYNQYSDK